VSARAEGTRCDIHKVHRPEIDPRFAPVFQNFLRCNHVICSIDPDLARLLKSFCETESLEAVSDGAAVDMAVPQRVDKAGNLLWDVDVNRVKRVLLKLARGHIAYEPGLPKLEEPDALSFIPLILMPEEERFAFESPANSSVRLWPEIGSRAFIKATKGLPNPWFSLA
jgi:hypothetical protein